MAHSSTVNLDIFMCARMCVTSHTRLVYSRFSAESEVFTLFFSLRKNTVLNISCFKKNSKTCHSVILAGGLKEKKADRHGDQREKQKIRKEKEKIISWPLPFPPFTSKDNELKAKKASQGTWHTRPRSYSNSKSNQRIP